ncbi:unnamed protein product [Mytilus coruscus]|uniref:ANK n=1 Tax=Mytilus coruscus TaxID=42192 RepID=A0A6J8AMW1_MYTCO|nr:unnamed protein product [Mytilus coruscus]
MACTNGHEEVVRILLRHNLPVKNLYFAEDTCTPLYYASMKGHLNIVKLLLNAKAQVNECDISVAEWNDHEEVVKCLRNHLIAGEFDTKYVLSECIRYGNSHTVLQSVISESSFKKTPTASRKLLLSGFDKIEGIYVKREGNRLSFINDIIYDVVISCTGSRFINSIVKFAEYTFIENRVKLESFTTEETPKSACIVLNQTYNEIYFERLLLEIRNGNEKVFANIQNKNQGYRKVFIEYLTAHLTDSDVDSLKSPLVLSCKMGYDDFVLYLVGKWNRLLEYSIYETETPLAEACSRGYFDIVKILKESEKYRDTGVIRNSNLPILCACDKGYTNVVKFLLTHGVYQDLNSGFVASVENGHTEIVLLLIEKEPKLLERNG